MRGTKKNTPDVQEYRLSELEREVETLAKQTYHLALRHEDFRQELKDARKEAKRGFNELSDLLHNRLFWLILTLLAGLFVIAILVVDFRLDLLRLPST